MKTAGKGSKWKRTIIIYMAVWSACVLWFWLGVGSGGLITGIAAYAVLSFGLILPLTTLVSAFLLEWEQNLRYWRWAAMGFFSIMYLAVLWVTFVLSTRLEMTNIAAPPSDSFLVGLCSSAIGIALGALARKRKMSLRAPAVGLFLLLAVFYVVLKTRGGSLLRPVLILDVPAGCLLVLFGVWLFFQRKQAKSDE